MMFSRRDFLLGALPASLASLGCQQRTEEEFRANPVEPKESSPAERLSEARHRAADFLISRQTNQGAWCSDTYGTFKDGTALTPLVLNALLAAVPDRQEAIGKAACYLASMVRSDGAIQAPSYGFDFGLYTAALTVTALSRPRCPDQRRARAAWLDFLQRRQLTEELGWRPTDREYGGWGYSREAPHKPQPGQLIPPLTESNLSATTFALEALRAAGVPVKDQRIAKALHFVRRCQNWENDPNQRDPRLDDGGFFFIYGDPVRNKAGVAGKDRAGRERYHSYGSASADGLRCLIHCGVPEADPRLQAARSWLVQHFERTRHPGAYEPRREMDRMAVFYYYAASVSQAPAQLLMVPTAQGPAPMKEVLAQELLQQQREDGSWNNPAHAIREDDALVATSFALLAMA
jgi:hypothetical protein